MDNGRDTTVVKLLDGQMEVSKTQTLSDGQTLTACSERRWMRARRELTTSSARCRWGNAFSSVAIERIPIGVEEHPRHPANHLCPTAAGRPHPAAWQCLTRCRQAHPPVRQPLAAIHRDPMRQGGNRTTRRGTGLPTLGTAGVTKVA